MSIQMKTLLGVYFIPRSFLKDELRLSCGGTNNEKLREIK